MFGCQNNLITKTTSKHKTGVRYVLDISIMHERHVLSSRLRPLQGKWNLEVSHLLVDDAGMIPPGGVTAERCTHVASPSDGAAHCELQTVSSAQPEHSD